MGAWSWHCIRKILLPHSAYFDLGNLAQEQAGQRVCLFSNTIIITMTSSQQKYHLLMNVLCCSIMQAFNYTMLLHLLRWVLSAVHCFLDLLGSKCLYLCCTKERLKIFLTFTTYKHTLKAVKYVASILLMITWGDIMNK